MPRDGDGRDGPRLGKKGEVKLPYATFYKRIRKRLRDGGRLSEVALVGVVLPVEEIWTGNLNFDQKIATLQLNLSP